MTACRCLEMTSLIDHSIKFSLVSLQISNSKCDQSSKQCSCSVGRNTNRSPDSNHKIKIRKSNQSIEASTIIVGRENYFICKQIRLVYFRSSAKETSQEILVSFEESYSLVVVCTRQCVRLHGGKS